MNYYEEYLGIESIENGNIITISIPAAVTSSDISWIAWSKDKNNWTTTNITSSDQTITVSLDSNEIAYFKGSGSRLGNPNGYTKFSSTKNFNLLGNINSLTLGDNFNTNITQGNYMYRELFYQCTKLVNANNLILPATTVAFQAYRAMFHGCTSLTSAPFLTATTLATNCYYNMFYGCSSLTVAPKLPATTLATYCYNQMFCNCTSLVKTPELPAIELVNTCYYQMFKGCSSLNYVTCFATSGFDTTNTLTNWLQNTSATGTFIKHPDATFWTTDSTSGIPSGWTVKNMNPQVQSLDFNDVNGVYVKGNQKIIKIYGQNGTVLWEENT